MKTQIHLNKRKFTLFLCQNFKIFLSLKKACAGHFCKHKWNHSVTGNVRRRGSHSEYSAEYSCPDMRFLPLVTWSLFELHQTPLTRRRLWQMTKRGVGNFWHMSSVFVSVSHITYLFLCLCPRHTMYCSGSVIIFPHRSDSGLIQNVAVTVLCVSVVPSLHSTPLHSNQKMLLNPPAALLRLMNRRRVPEGRHIRRQVSPQLPHLACAACRSRRKHTHVRARICRRVGDEFNPVTHTGLRRPCAVSSTCVEFLVRCAPTRSHLESCIIQSCWME